MCLKNVSWSDGLTIKFPGGGVGSFQKKKKITLAMRIKNKKIKNNKKKKSPPSGGGGNITLFSRGFFSLLISATDPTKQNKTNKTKHTSRVSKMSAEMAIKTEASSNKKPTYKDMLSTRYSVH